MLVSHEPGPFGVQGGSVIERVTIFFTRAVSCPMGTAFFLFFFVIFCFEPTDVRLLDTIITISKFTYCAMF